MQKPKSPDIRQRKSDHIAICTNQDVAFRAQGTLLDEVRLIHEALPDRSLDEVDLGVELCGKRLQAPLIIAAMTGGTAQAAKINHALAKIAEDKGLGFGLGSQRTMQKHPESAWTYNVREWAPHTLVLGNVGVVQARESSDSDLVGLVEQVGIDALCVHMNPAMELVQAEGDRDFSGGAATFKRLANALPVPIIGKETGCGISLSTAAKLRDAGVRYVDVSGAGGTSWVGVEALRAQDAERQLGEHLWDWGVPTAASVAYCSRAGLCSIATGGIRTGLDVARALALGARAAGIARPILQALQNEGAEGAARFIDAVLHELRVVMLLCGVQNAKQMQEAPRVLGPNLRSWLEVEDPSESR